MTKQYAIFTFRDTGPLKTWAAVRGAQVHNSREKPIAHASGDAAPRHMIGSGNLVADVKNRLIEHGIDPTRMRKNGVIAYEAVLTASPAFFSDPSTGADPGVFQLWTVMQRGFLLEKYGSHRIVSLVLHTDESTPHLHAVILPLVHSPDQRSGGKARWSLVGRSISGPGEFDRLQDDYAESMEDFGLSRGEVKSGQKHKPVKTYLAELKAQEEANAGRAVELEAMLSRVRDDMAAAEQDKLEVAKERRALEDYRKELAMVRDRLSAKRKVLEAECGQAYKIQDMLEQSRMKAADFLGRARAFPQSQWTKQAIVMARSAERVLQAHENTQAMAGNLEIQKAWLAERAGKGL